MPREQILRLQSLALDLRETAKLTNAAAQRQRDSINRLRGERQVRARLFTGQPKTDHAELGLDLSRS